MDDLLKHLPAFLFWVFASMTALCAIAVVVSQNIVRSATWLLFTLCGTSALFFLMGADFVGATQLLVYVGGTLVLVIFGVMLTAQGPFINMKTSAAEWAISATVGLLLLAVLVVSIISNVGRPAPSGTAEKYAPKERIARESRIPDQAKGQPRKSDDGARGSKYADILGNGFVGVGVGPAHQNPNDRRTDGTLGVVRTNYLLPFEIVSVHLLVVLIGAAYLARAKRRAKVPEGPRVATRGPGG
jgi:NADH-quinone oxidoreductase subunit J